MSGILRLSKKVENLGNVDFNTPRHYPYIHGTTPKFWCCIVAPLEFQLFKLDGIKILQFYLTEITFVQYYLQSTENSFTIYIVTRGTTWKSTEKWWPQRCKLNYDGLGTTS